MARTSQEKSKQKEGNVQPTTGNPTQSGGGGKADGSKRPTHKLEAFTLSQIQKDYLLPLFPDFTLAKANKGTRKGMNGKKFVDGILPDFMARFRILRGKDNEKEKKQLEDAYAEKIYNWYNNNKKGILAELSKVLSQTTPKNLWYYDYPSITSNAVQQYLKEKKVKFTIGEFCRLQHKKFMACDKRIRETYIKKAREHNEQARAAGPLTGEPHQVFVKDFSSCLSKLLEDGFKKGGIITMVNFMHEAPPDTWVDNEKHMVVSLLTTSKIEAYQDTKDHNDSSRALATWVHEFHYNKAQSAAVSTLRPSVYPNCQAEGLPMVPVLGPDPRVALVREIYHDFFTAMWGYGGGQTSVPWALIMEDIAKGGETWICRLCLPNPKVTPLVLPSRLTLGCGLEWVEHFKTRHNGGPLEQQLQFTQTLALKPPPVLSAALCPCPTMKYRAQTVYILRYPGPISKSEAVAGIPYNACGWRWLKTLTGGGISLENPLKLPTVEVTMEDPLISEEEVWSWKELFGDVWPEIEENISALVTCLNEAETLGPYSPLDGMWAAPPGNIEASIVVVPLPGHLPQQTPSDTEHVNFVLKFWFPPDFFQAPWKLRTHATIDHIKQFMVKGLPQLAAVHAPSKTIIGGKRGGSWLVCGQAMLLANIAACNGLITPPIPAPELYETDQLTDTHWKHAKVWGQSLLDQYRSSNDILRQSIPERIWPPLPEPGCDLPGEEVSTEEEHHETELEAEASPRLIPRKQPNRRGKALTQDGPSNSKDGAGASELGDSSEWSNGDTFQPPEQGNSSEEDVQDQGLAGPDPKGKRPAGASGRRCPRIKSYQASHERKGDSSPTKTNDTNSRLSDDGDPRTITELPAPPIEEEVGIQSPDNAQDSLIPVNPRPVATSDTPHSFPHNVPLDFSVNELSSDAHIFGPFGTPKNYDPSKFALMELAALVELTHQLCLGLVEGLTQWTKYHNEYQPGYTNKVWTEASLIHEGVACLAESKACLEIILVFHTCLNNAQQDWPTFRAHHLRLLNMFLTKTARACITIFGVMSSWLHRYM